MEKNVKNNDVDFTSEFINELTKIIEEKVNKAVNKMFTDVNGKKLDTYDLVRKFAMETIGVTENGKLKPEFLKVVREEVANIIVKKGLEEDSINDIECDEDCECECNECDAYDEGYDNGYNDGYTDGLHNCANTLNTYFKKNNVDCNIKVTDDNQQLEISYEEENTNNNNSTNKNDLEYILKKVLKNLHK